MKFASASKEFFRPVAGEEVDLLIHPDGCGVAEYVCSGGLPIFVEFTTSPGTSAERIVERMLRGTLEVSMLAVVTNSEDPRPEDIEAGDFYSRVHCAVASEN